MRTYRVYYVSGAVCEIRCEEIRYEEGDFFFRNHEDYPLIIDGRNLKKIEEVHYDRR